MSNFRDYVTSTAFALTISHRQIQCMCEIHQWGESYRLLSTFQALERKGLVARVPSDEKCTDGAIIQLTEAGLAVIPLLKLAGLYVEVKPFHSFPQGQQMEAVVELREGRKPTVTFHTVEEAPACP